MENSAQEGVKADRFVDGFHLFPRFSFLEILKK
jgi:hypothetical protein